jgi:hypothetical protein
MLKFLTDLLAYGGAVALFVFGIIFIDRFWAIMDWACGLCVRFLDWRDARRKPRGWRPGGYRVGGVTRL